MPMLKSFVILTFIIAVCGQNDLKQTPRFLLYDVNPVEGFNLRRDVYLRMAVLATHLRALQDWTLVLPPWSSPYHWRSQHLPQERVPWSKFFDVKSLNKFVPVIELHSLIEQDSLSKLDKVIILEHFDYQENSLWQEKIEEVKCKETEIYFWREEEGNWRGKFWNYPEMSAYDVRCIALQGLATTLVPFLAEEEAKYLMLDRAEVALHHAFGDAEYWAARRSMRFANHLVQAARDFRKLHLNSSDESDDTVLPEDWTKETQREINISRGGPYIGVHFRRKDFVMWRSKDVPSVAGAANQIKDLAKKHGLNKVFVASDGTENELSDLKKALLPLTMFKYEPTQEELEVFLDGGVAIIEQIICAHSRAFIGTYESTFSFRIQEEREIRGFHPDTTFRRLCGDDDIACQQPSRWRIQYE